MRRCDGICPQPEVRNRRVSHDSRSCWVLFPEVSIMPSALKHGRFLGEADCKCGGLSFWNSVRDGGGC